MKGILENRTAFRNLRMRTGTTIGSFWVTCLVMGDQDWSGFSLCQGGQAVLPEPQKGRVKKMPDESKKDITIESPNKNNTSRYE